MNTEPITAPRVFPFSPPKRRRAARSPTTWRIVKLPPEPERRALDGAEIAVIRYLGIHCGSGGQVVIPFRLREAAARTARQGLVQIWFRHEIGVGLSNPFYGLTVRGQQLAAALLCPRPKTRRATPAGANHGATDVSTR